LNFWIAIPSAIIIYLLALFLTKTLDETDKSILKNILTKN
jgi:hypothetical protein